ncbi:MAG: AsmA-like C-terminal region-containing protein, partial [Rhodoblastus sp.]
QSDDLAPLAPLFAFGAPDPSLHIPLRGTARLRLDGQGLALHKIDAEVSGVRASGDLQRDWAGVISGGLALERLSASDLAGLVLGPAQPAASGAVWPSLKFAPSRFDPPQANIALDVAHLDLGADIAARDAHMNLALGPGALVAQDMAMALGKGRLSGEIALRREGAAATFRARLSGQDIKADVQPFSARVGGALDVSGSGGSSAELVASLAGQGRLRFSDTRIAHAAPDALVAIVAHEDAPATIVAHEDALDARALEKKLDDAFDKGAQEPGNLESEATVAAGKLTLSPAEARAGQADVSLSGALDLHTGAMEARETLSLATPENWSARPRVTLEWNGGAQGFSRTIHAQALIAALAERAIAREKERNAALEADIRERAMFNRRLRMDRRNAEERRALEDAKRLMNRPAVRETPPARNRPAPARGEPARDENAAGRNARPRRPPAAFAPAAPQTAPDPSTAGRY